MKDKRILLLHILTVLISVQLFVAPLTLTAQKLNLICLRLGQKVYAMEPIQGVDTVLMMNTVNFHKLFINRYGEDKYYDVLKNLKSNRLSIQVVALLKRGVIKDWRLCIPTRHQYLYELMGDSTFAEKLMDDIKNSYIFLYPIYHVMHINDSTIMHGYLVFNISYHNKDIDTLSKDEFLKLQTHRIDSILTKTHLRYRRYDSPQIYDTDEYPLFNDSVKPIICK